MIPLPDSLLYKYLPFSLSKTQSCPTAGLAFSISWRIPVCGTSVSLCDPVPWCPTRAVSLSFPCSCSLRSSLVPGSSLSAGPAPCLVVLSLVRWFRVPLVVVPWDLLPQPPSVALKLPPQFVLPREFCIYPTVVTLRIVVHQSRSGRVSSVTVCPRDPLPFGDQLVGYCSGRGPVFRVQLLVSNAGRLLATYPLFLFLPPHEPVPCPILVDLVPPPSRAPPIYDVSSDSESE